MKKSKYIIVIISLIIITILISKDYIIRDIDKKEKKIKTNPLEVDIKKTKKIDILVPDYAMPTEDMIKDFEKETGIKPNFKIMNWSRISKTLEYEENKPDIVQLDWTWVGRYKNLKLISPIDISSEVLDTIPSLKAFEIENKFYAIPYFNDFKIGLYNQKQYTDSEIDNIPRTWEEIYYSSKQIRDKNINRYPYHIRLSDTEYTAIDFISLAFARNGIVFNEDGSISLESANDTLNFINQMYKEGYISPTSKDIFILDDYRRMATGETSFMIGNSSYLIGLNDKSKSSIAGEIKDIRIPGKDDISSYIFSCPEGLAIMESSKDKESAKKYIDWFTSKEVQKKLFLNSNILPSRLDVLEETIKSKKINTTGELLESARIASTPIPDIDKVYMKEILEIISYSINSMIIEEKSLEESLYFMDNSIRNVLNGDSIPDEVKQTVN